MNKDAVTHDITNIVSRNTMLPDSIPNPDTILGGKVFKALVSELTDYVMSWLIDDSTPPYCNLRDGVCDNSCGLFGDCPIEELDVAQGASVKKFIERIIRAARGSSDS